MAGPRCLKPKTLTLPVVPEIFHCKFRREPLLTK